MAVKTRFEGPVLRVIASGEYAWADVQAGVHAAMRKPGFEAGRSVLLFDTEATEASRSSDELRDIAAELSALASSFSAVIVVAVDDLRYGLARMLAAYADHLGTEVLVFRSWDAADAWVRARSPTRP